MQYRKTLKEPKKSMNLDEAIMLVRELMISAGRPSALVSTNSGCARWRGPRMVVPECAI
jgi:hypothetical protein